MYQIRRILKALFRKRKIIFDRLDKFLPYKPIVVSRDEWNKNFMQGGWERIADIQELSHYSCIAGYCQYFKSQKILDVGCGCGILFRKLVYTYEMYVGIDFSLNALARSSKNLGVKSYLINCDLEKIIFKRKFNIIIFNEILYYQNDPVGVLKYYSKMLEKGGNILISMYKSSNTDKIWRMISKEFLEIDHVEVKNKSGTVWKIKVLRPSN